MPKVLRIINRFNLGGITYNVSYLSKYLTPEFETVLIGGPEESNEQSSLFIPHSLGLEPIIIPEMRRSILPLRDYFAYRKIRQIIRHTKPDIVHTHASKAGALGRLAALHEGVPVIVHTFHGHVFKGYFGKTITRLYKNIERYLAARSTAIVAISAIQKHELSVTHEICEPEKIQVIPLGFDLKRFTENQTQKRQEFRNKFHLKEDELAVGIIGRLAPIKNHFLFIDAIAGVLQRSNRKLKALIIGDGEMRPQLEAQVARLDKSIASQFIFTGWINEADVALAGLDLVCLSSNNEGTPVSLIEAQAAGRFVVSTNVGGIKDILHPDCGLLCEAGDTSTYTDNLLEAVTNFERLAQKATSAQQDVLQRFSYQRLCADMALLYNQLLTAKLRKH